MPIVQVSLLAGRTAEQKKAMAVEITDTINKHSGAPKEVKTVTFSDIERASWAAGGKLYSEKQESLSADRAIKKISEMNKFPIN